MYHILDTLNFVRFLSKVLEFLLFVPVCFGAGVKIGVVGGGRGL